jgi:hypothetical protein
VSDKTAIISLYSMNWLVFITETECVYCGYRLGLCIKIKLILVFIFLNSWIERTLCITCINSKIKLLYCNKLDINNSIHHKIANEWSRPFRTTSQQNGAHTQYVQTVTKTRASSWSQAEYITPPRRCTAGTVTYSLPLPTGETTQNIS